MSRNILTLLEELTGAIQDLKSALKPLDQLTAPAPARRGRPPKAAAAKEPKAPRARRAPRAPRVAAPKTPKAPKAPRAPRALKAAKVEAAASPAPKPAKKAQPSNGRVLQGRYIGMLRKLSKADQAEIKKIRAEAGTEAAIKAAEAKVG